MLADFLFFDAPLGWTLGLFAIVLLLAVRMHAHTGQTDRAADIASFSALGLALALIEMPSFGGVVMCLVNMVALALLPRLSRVEDARVLFRNVLRYLIAGWPRLAIDVLMIAHVKKRLQKRHGRKRSLVRHWLLPCAMSALFVGLFAQANPIITQWLDQINFAWLMQFLSLARIDLAVSVAFGSWALIRPKFKQRFKTAPKTSKPFTLTALLFNERSIMTSLMLFNGLFLVQNLMDVLFLWSGAALPDGMTYARYAHQGAYPLIATALLAAVFVLIALKPGSSTEARPKIRALVFAWVAQNIFLVLSSIIRTLGYIDEYSLTYLRVAALIWMALVAVGLLLIIVRIHLGKTNLWLINSNVMVLTATLYLCCFVNFGGMIAWHNVTHSREADGALLDVEYLERGVGVEAIPALRWYERTHPESASIAEVQKARRSLDATLERSMSDWHRWTFRKYRIAQAPNSTPATY